METILTIFAYCMQIGTILLIAAGLAFFGCIGKLHWKRYLLSFGVSFLIVCGILAYLAFHPIVICPDGYQAEFTDEMRDAAVALGAIYSENIPLIRVAIGVTDIREDTVYFTEYYFVTGTVGMTYGPDSYNCVKYLSGLS